MENVNPAHISAVIQYVNSCAFFEMLSLKVVEISAGYGRCETVLSEKHLNPYGGLHGGVYASVIDTVAALAAYCSVPEDKGMISIDLHVDNISAAREGKLIAEGRLLKAGRTICFTEATISDEHGKLLAHGTSKLLVISGVQVFSEAMPPKYI